MLFPEPDKGGGGEGGKRRAVRERDVSLRTVLSLAFTLIYPLRLKNISRYVHQPDGHSRHCFSTSAAAQKAGLDGAGAPRDVPEFGKGVL